MSENDIAVKVEHLYKQYKMYPTKKARLLETMFPKYQNHTLFDAVKDLNLVVRRGEILGILGQNGAGKSTLLKMITGVATPTSGTIQINGILSSLLELGTAFNMDLTGIENIYQHGQVSGLTNEQITDRLPTIIEFADIGNHMNQPVKTYSSGMFARLAFACAIHIDPEVLIVDEVLSVGDIRFQMKCYNKFEEFKEQGKTILFVTHNISDILRNCTRAIIMNGGQIVMDGDVRDVVDEYKKLMVGIDITAREKKVEEERRKEEAAKELQQAEEQQSSEEAEEAVERRKNYNIDVKGPLWKDFYPEPPKKIEYGNGKATIFDYGMFTEKSESPALNIDNNEVVTVKMKVKFHEDIDEPIFAIAVKDIKRIEVCGTNTFAYHYPTGAYKADEEVEIEFKQSIPVAPGTYSLSFGCTKYDEAGELEVFDRKYDVIIFDVVSDREALGLLDLKSEININK